MSKSRVPTWHDPLGANTADALDAVPGAPKAVGPDPFEEMAALQALLRESLFAPSCARFQGLPPDARTGIDLIFFAKARASQSKHQAPSPYKPASLVVPPRPNAIAATAASAAPAATAFPSTRIPASTSNFKAPHFKNPLDLTEHGGQRRASRILRPPSPSSPAPASSPVPPLLCASYRIDMTAMGHTVCECGFKKEEHIDPLFTRSRRATTGNYHLRAEPIVSSTPRHTPMKRREEAKVASPQAHAADGPAAAAVVDLNLAVELDTDDGDEWDTYSPPAVQVSSDDADTTTRDQRRQQQHQQQQMAKHPRTPKTMKPRACQHFSLDMMARQFGQCRCGFLRSEHNRYGI